MQRLSLSAFILLLMVLSDTSNSLASCLGGANLLRFVDRVIAPSVFVLVARGRPRFRIGSEGSMRWIWMCRDTADLDTPNSAAIERILWPSERLFPIILRNLGVVGLGSTDKNNCL